MPTVLSAVGILRLGVLLEYSAGLAGRGQRQMRYPPEAWLACYWLRVHGKSGKHPPRLEEMIRGFVSKLWEPLFFRLNQGALFCVNRRRASLGVI